MKISKFIKIGLSALGLASVILFSNAGTALAGLPSVYKPLEFRSQIGIPGLIGQNQTITLSANDTSYIARMVKAFYEYGQIIAGVLAVVVLMAGGLIWLTSGGSQEKISQAKNLIGGSIIGIFILFGSWIILKNINPNLITLKVDSVLQVQADDLKDLICCDQSGIASMKTRSDCEDIQGKVFATNADGSPYTVNSNGKSCVVAKQLGCCVDKYEATSEYINIDGKYMPVGTITYKCTDKLEQECSTETDYSHPFNITGIFYPSSCSSVNECNTGNTIKAVCTTQDGNGNPVNVKDGSRCQVTGGQYTSDCFCYNGQPYWDKGSEGQPCGNEKGSVCKQSCTGAWAEDSYGGRKCDVIPGTVVKLQCCYDRSIQ